MYCYCRTNLYFSLIDCIVMIGSIFLIDDSSSIFNTISERGKRGNYRGLIVVFYFEKRGRLRDL